jgi:hypothetical protein
MFCVHVGSNKLSTLTHHFRQNGFALPVNRYHLNHFNDVPPRVACEMRFSPSRLQLIRPLADQLTLQGPPLPVGQIGYSDFEHVALNCLTKTAGAGSPNDSRSSRALYTPDELPKSLYNRRRNSPLLALPIPEGTIGREGIWQLRSQKPRAFELTL